MPIVRDSQGSGLTHRGRLRLGEMVEQPGKKPYPRKTDHFVTKDAPLVARVYGKTPTTIEAALVGRTPNECARAYYERYTGGGAMVCQGTGAEVQQVYREHERSWTVRGGRCQVEYQEDDGTVYSPGTMVPCEGPKSGLYPRCEECGLNVVLQFFAIDPETGGLVGNEWGYHDIATGSVKAHDHIMSTLELMYQAALAAGRSLFGVRFILELVPAMRSVTDPKGKRIRVSQAELRIRPTAAWTEVVGAFVLAQSGALELPDSVVDVPRLTAEDIATDAEPSIHPEIQDMIDALHAARRQQVPPTLAIARAWLAETCGDDFDVDDVMWTARDIAGLGRTEPIEWNQAFWLHMLDAAVLILTTGGEQ